MRIDTRERIMSTGFPTEDSVVLWDVLPVASDQKLRLTFLAADDPAKQAVRIAIDVGGGSLTVNGVEARDMRLVAKDGPVDISCNCPAGILSVYQKWWHKAPGNPGTWRSQLRYSGMLIEEVGATRTYHCNNGNRLTDFDKLVFKVELLP